MTKLTNLSISCEEKGVVAYMSNYTYESAIRDAIFSMPEGHIFALSDLLDLASYDSLRRVLSDFCTAGYIQRIIIGIYRNTSHTSPAAETDPLELDVAVALARSNGWRIVPGTETARHLLGLSPEQPSYFLYLSTGPTGNYTYGKGRKVRLIHSGGKFITAMSDKSALVTSALMDLKYHNITPREIAVLSSVLTQEEKDHLMAERMYAPARLRPVFEIICGKYGAK